MRNCNCPGPPQKDCPPEENRGCSGCLAYFLAGLAILLLICLIGSPCFYL
ncbi:MULTISPECIES: hypothetical protein [Anaerotruncus]|jgi:hypothetical protein|nr:MULTISPECIES: hypothetical protein [Anaerotruncus]